MVYSRLPRWPHYPGVLHKSEFCLLDERYLLISRRQTALTAMLAFVVMADKRPRHDPCHTGGVAIVARIHVFVITAG